MSSKSQYLKKMMLVFYGILLLYVSHLIKLPHQKVKYILDFSKIIFLSLCIVYIQHTNIENAQKKF